MRVFQHTSKARGKVLDKQKEFVALMLMCGQIELLKKISGIIGLKYSEHYIKIKDRYFY